MKRLGVILFTAALAVAISVQAFGFFTFGYTHGIPTNAGKAYLGLDFGAVQTGEFNVFTYVGDLWLADPVLGLEAFYQIATCGDCPASGFLDLEVGGYLESSGLSGWPVVGTGDAGLYIDSIFHVLPGPCGEDDPCGIFCLDLIFNLALNVDACTGLWDLGGEVGFEMEL